MADLTGSSWVHRVGLRRDHGSAVANRVSRHCIVPPWRDGGQSQYVELPVPEPRDAGERGGTAAARAWALDRLDEPRSLREPAVQAGMSVRTFTRRFHEEVGTSPGQWLLLQRAERARQLLEETELTVEQSPGRLGFGTAASLRQHLRELLGVAPSAHRRTFRAGAGTAVRTGV